MHVLLVGNYWTDGPGGAETTLVLTADLLRRAGHEVVPFAVAEEGTLHTPVRDRLRSRPAAAPAAVRGRRGPAPGRRAPAGPWRRSSTKSAPTSRTCTTSSSG